MKWKEIEERLDRMDLREKAEMSYALGMHYKSEGKMEKQREYGQKSYDTFKELNIQTIEDAAPRYQRINEIEMPNLIHENVVKRDLL